VKNVGGGGTKDCTAGGLRSGLCNSIIKWKNFWELTRQTDHRNKKGGGRDYECFSLNVQRTKDHQERTRN